MPGKGAKVVVTETQQEILMMFRDARTSPKHLAQRAEIVLLGFEKQTNEDVAHRVGLERHQVGTWRLRRRDDWGRLTLVECSETRTELERATWETLSDQPRPGSPGTFTPEQITQIIALACEAPEKSGRPITHWTHKELADEAAKRGIVESISPSRVGCYLREAELKPHKNRYWLNAKEKEQDPAAFKQQVQTVCGCYLEARERHEQEGRHTVCVDEMTGIQALERIAPTKPMQPGRPAQIEFGYARHGTQTLIGNFEVASGELISPTIGPTHTEKDFVTHIAATVHGEPLEKKREGILKSMDSRKEFLSRRVHRIRFVYVPKHTSWLNQIEIVFATISRKVIRRGSFASVEVLRDRLLEFINYFNQVMAKPFKWTYTDRPLQIA